MKVAFVTEIPAPFRIPQWDALADLDDVELHVIFLAEHDPRRSYAVERDGWRFEGRALPGLSLRARGRWLRLNRGLPTALRSIQPDVVVVGGWNQPAFFRALAYARKGRRPAILWVESTARDERPRTALTERVKRRALASVAAVVVPGRAAAEYVASLGVGDDAIVVAPNAVDHEFVGRLEEMRPARADIRRRLGLDRACVLCVSRLSREKGVDVLVEAARGLEADVVVAGGGPEEGALRRALPANVRLLGWVAPDELLSWYAAADVFALASRSETWGMALGEAAAAGLPLVASDAVGAGYDLIEPGVNGFRVPVGSAVELRAALASFAADGELCARAAARSRELAASRPADFAEAIAGLARRLTV